MDDKLIRLCEERITRYDWKLLTPDDLAKKVSEYGTGEDKWEWLIPREYFNHLHQMLTHSKGPDRTEAEQELWQFIQRRSVEFGRRKGLEETDDLEDVASLTALLVWKNLDKVHENFFAFVDYKIRDALKRIIRDKAGTPSTDRPSDTLDEQQQKKKRPKRLDEKDDVSDRSPSVPEVIEASSIANDLWSVINHKLKTYPRPVQRKLRVIELRWKREKTYEEIAAELDISTGNAQTMHSRGLEFLSQNEQVRKLNEYWR